MRVDDARKRQHAALAQERPDLLLDHGVAPVAVKAPQREETAASAVMAGVRSSAAERPTCWWARSINARVSVCGPLW
jgi:hypothetical protein